MRVMLLIQRYPPHHIGGYELRFRDIADGLRRSGHLVSVVTSTFGVESPARHDDGTHRVLTLTGEVHGVTGIARLIRSTWCDAIRLRAAIRSERPDVLLVGNFSGLSAGLWSVLRSARIPLVLDVSNDWLLDLASSHGNWFRIWERPWRGALRRTLQSTVRTLLNVLAGGALGTRFPGIGAARVYVTAPHQVERLRAAPGLGDVPIDVCPSGVDLGALPFRPGARAIERLLYVGRLKPLKGVHTAVAALRQLPKTVSLTIVGVPDDRPYEQRLRADAQDLGSRVSFHAPVSWRELPAVFAAHDALVFPTHGEEAFSRLILEAMACGLPVIATPTGGTPEAVEDGVTGLMFPPRDEQALAASVRRLAADDDLRQRIIGAGRRQVEDRFNLDAAVARIERVLSDAARAGVPA